MAYQPPITFANTFGQPQNKAQKLDDDFSDFGFTNTSSSFSGARQNDTLSNRKKGGNNSNQLFNPDDILSSFGSDFSNNKQRANLGFEDDYQEENIKESTGLLSSQGSKPMNKNLNMVPQNAFQSKQLMQSKNQKETNATNERPQNLFQKYIFDPFKYQTFFDTTTQEIQDKLVDALWPFIPANQHHLIENDAESIREFKTKPGQNELYGPLWIMSTLIIELCILGHLQTALSSHKIKSSLTEEELLTKQANYSLQKVFKTTFLLLMFFVINPFICYLVFKNKGAMEVTYLSLFQIFSYSYAIFVPLAIVNCILMPFNRLRVFLILGSAAVSLYYVYKETKELLTKYIDDLTFKYIGGYVLGSCCFFLLLFRYYFLSA